ncbi:MAG: DUF418 domain-containing protein, partial [Pseudonocardiaceae bacterium]
ELRILEWVQGSVIGSVFLLVPAVMLGVWAARRRLLDDPELHRPFLLRVAVVGVGAAAFGGLPWALIRASWWQAPPEAVATLAGVTQTLTGYLGGVGYAAIAGLLAIRVRTQARSLLPVTLLAACGQRSMTCYLLQSVVFVAVLAAYGGGLGNRLGLVEIAALATVTWGLTVMLAGWMARRDHRGPAELLLRRLTYGYPVPR